MKNMHENDLEFQKKLEEEKCKFTKAMVSMGDTIYSYEHLIKLFKNEADLDEAIEKEYIGCIKNGGNVKYFLTDLGKKFARE